MDPSFICQIGIVKNCVAVVGFNQKYSVSLAKQRIDTNACDTILESGDPNDKIDSMSMMNLRIVIIDKWPSNSNVFMLLKTEKTINFVNLESIIVVGFNQKYSVQQNTELIQMHVTQFWRVSVESDKCFSNSNVYMILKSRKEN